ncbi:MAG: hypothetical protein D3920_02165 [Candidatus Electrothrix sp. AW2]|nr:hypothetical protein [Candidatus Electrothrix gigas]
MKINSYVVLLVMVLFFVSPASASNTLLSRHNYVDWIEASSAATAENHFVQWKSGADMDSACATSGGVYRTVISRKDKTLFSLLLVARLTNKEVGFVYEITTTSDNISGHGIPPCQLVNAWIESE